MGHNIPKIQWEDVNELVFDYPPTVDDGDQFVPTNTVSISISGVRQVSTNYVEIQRTVTFEFVTQTLKMLYDSFMSTWAVLGNTFKYFEDQNSGTFVYYEISDLQTKSKKIMPKTANSYLWQIPISMRRVLGIVEGEDTVLTILNNQASAVDLTGLIFDKTEYTQGIVTCELRRKTSLSELVSQTTLVAIYNSTSDSWDVTPTAIGDDCGVVFSITGAGQVQYTSTDMSGSGYIGTLKAKQSVFQA